MLFNSLRFLLFFPLCLLVCQLLPEKMRTFWLLASSYYFYMCWNARYVLLLLLTTLITYFSGLLLEGIKESNGPLSRKKLVVAFSFLSNLSILFFFKYANFALRTLQQICSLFHHEIEVPSVDVLLPVGISFFIFQALSYTMDVYRGEIYAEKNFFRYALFVSFFPQLVAGPIERSKSLLRQLAKPVVIRYENAREGFLLMLWGYFLKIVLADRIAVFVDTVYGNYQAFPGMYLGAATVLFAFQIYCDFAGYSTIAMGAAKVMGIDLMENFDAPYLAASVSDFWRRWHISLTSWFKDYLYIPLGGSRKGKLRKYLNKLMVFFLSGLWHGASFSFVVWGGINGLWQIIGEMLMPARQRVWRTLGLSKDRPLFQAFRVLATFLMVDFAWIFFRAETFRQALALIRCMFSVWNPQVLYNGALLSCGLSRRSLLVMGLGLVILFIADLLKSRGVCLRKRILACSVPVRVIWMAGCVLLILIFGIWGPAYNAANFIYFQF